jgi:hypothetical protein
VVKVEDNRGRRERRALATRAIEPAQLGLAGAAQIGCLNRQIGKEADPETEYLATSRTVQQLSIEQFLNTDREYWGVESGLHQRLDCSGFEDRLRVRHKGALHILGLFSRVGVALFVHWAKQQRVVRERTYPWWREWNSGHRWHMIRQVTEPVD